MVYQGSVANRSLALKREAAIKALIALRPYLGTPKLEKAWGWDSTFEAKNEQ